MYYEDLTREKVEENSRKGIYWVHQIKDISTDRPELISEEVWERAYRSEVRKRIEVQAIGGFEHGKGGYTGSIDNLLEGENTFFEAQNRGYNLDPTDFTRGVIRLNELSRDSFLGSVELRRYFEESKFTFEEQLKDVEERLPRLAQNYVDQLISRARKLAKKLKKNSNGSLRLLKKIENYFEKIDGLKEYGVFEERRVDQTKELAYRMGVEYPLRRAEVLDYSPKTKFETLGFSPSKLSKRINRAQKKMNVLGNDLTNVVFDERVKE